jgi:DNA polymerase elongation subunit (family B)
MFGITESGETASIFVDDFHPFFYIKVDDTWTDSTVGSFMSDIRKRMGKYYENSIVFSKLVKHNKLYGFTAGKKDNFIYVEFKNTRAMNKMKSFWFIYEGKEKRMKKFMYQNTKMEIYESNIPPLLRYFHINNISPSGWIYVPVNRSTESTMKSTTCTYEYICKKSQIKPLPDKETRVPYKICSFDIEASSSHGDFPIPVKSYKRLATNMVDVFQALLKNNSQAVALLKKVVLTAFGFDKFAGVDLVYPKAKHVITKNRIEKLIDILLTEPIENAKKMNTEENNAAVLTIDMMFAQQAKEVGADDTNEVGNDDAECDMESTAKFYGKPKPQKIATDSNTLIEVLTNGNYDREEKITLANDVLTLLFPSLEGDKVTFIGSTFMKYGEPEPYLNHCLVLKDCDPVEGATIDCASTERDILCKWTELIQEENPDIIIGYNIFGFDYEFMFRRAQENNCEREFLMLSRKRDELCAKEDSKTRELSIANQKIVLASGEYDLHYFEMSGRLQIDMYTYFRRDFNLPSYKLDSVAGQYISDDIKRVEYVDHPEFGKVTELFSKNLTGLHKNDYIHIEMIGFTSDYIQDGKKFKVISIETGREITETIKGKETTNKYNIIIIEGHPEMDRTKALKWGTAKDDVSPQDIFRLANGSSADRAVVAKYCIQDCNLVHHLMNKIDVITAYIEMSRICSVPISFLVFRGQGIKLTSYVAKKCREKDTLMPDIAKTTEADGYEGAIVLPPKCSMYMDNPVACVDYSSLYPSSMISQNLSHDSKVWTKEYDLDGKLVKETGEKDKDGNYIYDNLPDYQYINIEFDTFKTFRKTATSKVEKKKSGVMVCRWAQLPNGQKSILPSILEELLSARSQTRKMIKTESDPFMQNILDKRQLGYKVTANSLYGQCGAKTSTFYEKDIAASTTATGRQMIIYAKTIIEEVYGNREYDTECHGPVLTNAEYVYGDSVAEYTPVKVRIDNRYLDISTISELAAKYGGDNWVNCKEEGKQEKEFCELTNVESWTENGWTPLYRVIRHMLAPHKKMIRVLTHTGLVDVTDDHSLLSPQGKEITPKDCSVGTELLHCKMNHCDYIVDITYTKEQAQVMGFFFGDGSCGTYSCESGKKASWALNNASVDMITKYTDLCKIAYPEFDWTVMDTLNSSGVYKISPRSSKYGSITNFVKQYRDMMYYNCCKIIPRDIFTSSSEIQMAFWEGMYDADGDKDAKGYIRIDQKNQISAAHIAQLANILGWQTSINTRIDKHDVYRITMTRRSQRRNPTTVKKMYQIPYYGYVYDLTTENHHFAAGIGDMIVHNTDSVFFTFNLKDNKTGEKIRGKKALEVTIEIAQDAAKLCSKFLKPPMDLTYEKTLMPFILLSKKRYVGMLYEEDANKGKLKYMGLSLKRRDSCDYLKDVYGNILNILMKENNVQSAIQFLDTALENLIAGRVPMEKLEITKALRSDYKNPNQIAHKVLADRIGQRDPGNKPKPGDRMKFVFIVNSKGLLMGDRIETPEYIITNKLQIDYMYYITNQLMKPLQQLFGLALEQIWEHQGKTAAIKTFHKDMEKLEKETGDLEEFMKKKEKYCSKKIEALLFKKFLDKVFNEKNKIRTLDAFGFKK